MSRWKKYEEEQSPYLAVSDEAEQKKRKKQI